MAADGGKRHDQASRNRGILPIRCKGRGSAHRPTGPLPVRGSDTMNDHDGPPSPGLHALTNTGESSAGLHGPWLSQSGPNRRRVLDNSTPAGRLLVALKQQLRVKGLHYRDVATRLKISERTVKRYFSGKGLTIDILQRLADVVGLDMMSLVILAQQHSDALPEMSKQQQIA